MGIGPDADGPGPSSVVTALPGDLSDGVLLNESGGYLEFGRNPLEPYASALGASLSNLEVSVGNGGACHSNVPNEGYGHTVTSRDVTNTGNEAVQLHPVYISNNPDGLGTTVFELQLTGALIGHYGISCL